LKTHTSKNQDQAYSLWLLFGTYFSLSTHTLLKTLTGHEPLINQTRGLGAGARDISSTGESHSDVDNPPISAAEEVQLEAPASQSNSDADALSPQHRTKQTVQRADKGRPADVDERGQLYRDAAVPTKPTQEEVAVRAYELFLRRGSSPGYETEDWLHAEKELVEEYNSPK